MMLNDTAAWVTDLLNARRRELSAAQKLALVDDMNRGVFQLVLLGLLQRHPPVVAHRKLIEQRLGHATRLIDSYANEEAMEPNITATMLDFTRICEDLGIPYVVGGSVASALFGEERNTRDVDILIQLKSTQVAALFAALEPLFYAQSSDISTAVRDAPTYRDTPSNRATFNAIHRKTYYKVDAFVSSGRAFEVSQMQRRMSQVISTDGSTVFALSAEDVILAKLEWFEMSNRQLDHQWRDIRAVLDVQRDALDLQYLREWATTLGVSALLEKAIANQSPHDAPDSNQLRLF